MYTKIVQLRIKIRSLTQEARLIRQEENRALCRIPFRMARDIPPGVNPTVARRLRFQWRTRKGIPDVALYVSLSTHRRREVRGVAREAMLTYACLRGVPYAKVELRVGDAPPPTLWKRLREGVIRFGVCHAVGESWSAFQVREQQQVQAVEAWIQAAQVHIAQQVAAQASSTVQAA